MREAAYVLVHDVQIVLPVGGGLGAPQIVEPATDGGQGGAQFVRHGGQEFALQAIQGLEFLVGQGQLAGRALHLFLQPVAPFLQLGAHAAQCLAHAIHFMAAADMDPAGEFPLADAVGHGFKGAKGPEHQVADQEIQGHDREHDERQGRNEKLHFSTAQRVEHVLYREVDAQAAADRPSGVVLVAGQAGLVDIEGGRILEHRLSVVVGEGVIFRVFGLGEAFYGRCLECVGPVFGVHGRDARQSETVQVLAVGVEGELLGDHGRGEALHDAALRGQKVCIERAAALGAGGVLAQEQALAVRDPLAGQDDLAGQESGLVEHLGPGLPLLGHALPEEDDAQERHHDADYGRHELELQRTPKTAHDRSSRAADEPQSPFSSTAELWKSCGFMAAASLFLRPPQVRVRHPKLLLGPSWETA